jgi:hypothetical protein
LVDDTQLALAGKHLGVRHFKPEQRCPYIFHRNLQDPALEAWLKIGPLHNYNTELWQYQGARQQGTPAYHGIHSNDMHFFTYDHANLLRFLASIVYYYFGHESKYGLDIANTRKYNKGK